MRWLPWFLLLLVTTIFPASPWVRLGTAPDDRLLTLLVHDGRILAGTDSGLYRSVDGRRWEQVLDMDRGVFTLAAHGGSLYAGGYRELHRSEDGGATWDFIRIGDWFSASIRHGNRDFVAENGAGLLRTNDKGAAWKELDLGIVSPQVSVLASAGGALFAGGPWGILRSKDHGETWSTLGAGPGNSVNHMAVHRGILYAVCFPGCPVQRSADGGETWKALEGLSPDLVADLAVGDGVVFVSTQEGIFRYIEATGSWTKLPGSEALWGAELELAGADLLAGAGREIYRLRNYRSAK